MSEVTKTEKKGEVSAGSRKHFRYRGNTCLNCGQPLDLSDVYCSYCSQLNSTKPLSLKDFVIEFLSSVVNYDSRLRYTIKDLLFKPGTITRNYIKGQRLKYANPFRFFLSVSIIYFLLYSFISYFQNDSSNNQFGNFYQGVEDGQEENLDLGVLKIQVDSSENVDREEVIIDTIPKDAIDSITKKAKSDGNYEYEYNYLSEEDLQKLSNGERIFERFGMYRAYKERHENLPTELALDSLDHKNSAYNKFIYNKVDSIERIKEKPYEFVNYMIQKTPFFLFFFSPIFALFLWLLYSKKKHSYMAHLVFIFHIFSFVFLALLISTIPDLLIGGDVLQGILFTLVGPFYFYKALRNYYKQNRLITIIKFVFLNIFFWISALIVGLIFFFVTAALY